MPKKNKTTSDILEEVANTNVQDADKITLFELKTVIHERGFGIFMLIFSLPPFIPVPIPGYTTIFAIPLILFSIQLFIGLDSPWMPKWLERKSIKRSALVFIVERTSPILKRIEKIMQPRMSFVFCKFGEKFLALIIFLCSISIAIPLPFTHFFPSAGVAFISLGIISKDGLISLFGVVISFIGITITSVVLIAGPKILLEAFSFLKNFV
ncbi:MAG: exopolysaccharide biosynthesis protein [Wolbachia endosymbiont of Xenopsylla cheopis]